MFGLTDYERGERDGWDAANRSAVFWRWSNVLIGASIGFLLGMGFAAHVIGVLK